MKICRWPLWFIDIQTQWKKHWVLNSNSEKPDFSWRISSNYWVHRQLLLGKITFLQSIIPHCAYGSFASDGFFGKMAPKSRWRRVLHHLLQNGFIVFLILSRKGLYYDFDEPMVLLSELESQNPFVKFVRFLILSVQMKSREGYEKIGVGYKKFLGSDDFFAAIYEAYGAKFFKKEKPGSGLLNLLENWWICSYICIFKNIVYWMMG